MEKSKRNEKQKTITEAKTAVFRYLKYRPRSIGEIQTKLRDKGFGKDVSDQAIEYFQKIGSLNDEQFAIGWTRSRLNKPIGVYRIRQELKQKGINGDLISKAIADATQDYEELEMIMALAKRRMRKYTNLDTHAAKRRLYGYLARRGFNSGTIVKVMKQLLDQ